LRPLANPSLAHARCCTRHPQTPACILRTQSCRTFSGAARCHSGAPAQARPPPPGDTVVAESALSRNTDASPASADARIVVRALAAPTRREIDALAEIFDQYRTHYGEASDAARSADWLRQNLSTSRLRAFVAEDRGESVGFALATEVPASLRLAHFWQIRDLFVLPTHRRLGVGGALLASVRAAAIESGALRLVLQTEQDNDAALRLYAESGYTLIAGYCSLSLPLGSETPSARPAEPSANG